MPPAALTDAAVVVVASVTLVVAIAWSVVTVAGVSRILDPAVATMRLAVSALSVMDPDDSTND